MITGRVINTAGEPVADARVITFRKPPQRADAPAGFAIRPVTLPPVFIPMGTDPQTNDIGEFRVFGLPAGEYIVAVQGREEFTSSSRSSTVSVATYFPGTTDPAAAQPILLAAGQTYGDAVIRMIEAPAFHVSGTVRGANGRAIANAIVRVTSDTQATVPATTLLNRSQQTHTDSEGRFSLGVINGAYTLIAVPPEVISQARPEGGVTGGMSWDASGGVIGARVSGGGTTGMVTTEMRNGTTTRYRDAVGTRATITIADANIDNLEIVVR